MNFDDVAAIACQLPGVERSTSYGTPSLKVAKKFMARLREDNPDVLILTAVDDIEQQLLMDTQPDVFFKTPHYVGHPTILIRMSRVDGAELADMVQRSWRRLANKRLLAQRPA